jgi:hypothetical protein
MYVVFAILKYSFDFLEHKTFPGKLIVSQILDKCPVFYRLQRFTVVLTRAHH